MSSPTPASPAEDPAFARVAGAVRGRAAALEVHPSAAAEAQAAKDAAEPPSDDVHAQAETARIGTMDAAEPGGFDKEAFVAAVMAAVAAQTPPNLKEADEFEESGRPEAIGETVTGLMGRQEEASAAQVRGATEAEPDPSVAVEKPVTPMREQTPPRVAPVDAAAAMPRPVPEEQTNLDAPKGETDAKLAQAAVTEQQLAASNEPDFVGALEAKRGAEAHSATAPGQFRARETSVLVASRQKATASGQAGLEEMQSSAALGLARVAASKEGTKGADEAKRAEVTSAIRTIFDGTKRDVKAILNGLDSTVASQFGAKEKAARDAFTAEHKAGMAAYKAKRYGGPGGTALWIADELTSLPEEANDIYTNAKATYEERMRAVVAELAETIGGELARAKQRITEGRQQVEDYVSRQPRDLQRIAQEAAQDIGGQFDQLEADVDAKQQSLVDDLARSYVEARGAVDAEIEAMKEENKGLWDKATDAVGGAIDTIGKLKDMLLGVLARAAGVIGVIIRDPIGFLGSFVSAIKGGIERFATNIYDHLKQGLQAWLFGALAVGGIELPETFDLKGVLKLVASVIGLTWANIRSRIVKKIGEPVMGKVESGFEFVKLLVTEGVGGLWKLIVQKVGDLKERVMTQVKEMVVAQIIKAGITWLISLLNPAGAFIKACKIIYDIVMFFVEKAAQIKEFVDAVLDSVQAIAGGGVGAVATKIEQTLAKMLPVVIGFLASALGLGGITEKIKKIIETVQEPVNKAVDWVVSKAVHFGKGLLTKLTGRIGGKDETPHVKQERLDSGLSAAVALIDRLPGSKITGVVARPLLAAVKLRYRMNAIRLMASGGRWVVEGEVNPTGKQTTAKGLPPAVKAGTTGRSVADQLAAAGRLLGQPLTSGSSAPLGAVWTSVTNPGEIAILTKENSRRLFNNQRKRFWAAASSNPACVAVLQAAGATFRGKPGSAPVLTHATGEFRLTIDHIIERQAEPKKALSATNLRLSSTRENTVVLRQLHEQDPFLDPHNKSLALREVAAVLDEFHSK